MSRRGGGVGLGAGEDGEEDVAAAEIAEPSDNAWEVDAAATRIQARHRGNAARRGDTGDGGGGQPRRLRGAEFKLMQEADAARNIQVNTTACWRLVPTGC